MLLFKAPLVSLVTCCKSPVLECQGSSLTEAKLYIYIFRPPRLKNIDRSSATSMEGTVGNVTVIITDYKPKKEKERRTSVDTSHNGTSTPHNPPPPAPQSDSFKTENDDTNAVSIKNETLATNGELPKEEAS